MTARDTESGLVNRSPCGCDGCDEYAFSADSYCVKCHHHSCGHEVNCQ